MAVEKQMVAGFNHNVKHRGKAYHVQTEDSGLGNPRIITHLFVGGNIIASKKTSYADIVGAENLAQVVRELMEEQHKEMLRNLINGVYDDLDDELAAKARAYQPGQIAPETRAAPPAAVAPKAPAPKPPPIPQAPPANQKQPPSPKPPAAAQRSPAVTAPRAAAAGPTAQVAGPRSASPPAPAPAAPRGVKPASPQRPPEAPKAPQRPAPAQRREPGEMLFGEDLISEKSLDEVILSYLAEEQGEKKP